MYIYIYVYIHVCLWLPTHQYMRVYLYIYIYIYIWVVPLKGDPELEILETLNLNPQAIEPLYPPPPPTFSSLKNTQLGSGVPNTKPNFVRRMV